MIFLLPLSILALVYLVFRYPVLQGKLQEHEDSTNLFKAFLFYPPLILFLAAGLFSGEYGLVYLTTIFLALPAAVKLRIPRVVYILGFLLIGVWVFYAPMKEAYELRRDALAYQELYPLESLSERLAYESKASAGVGGGEPHESLALPGDSEAPLTAPPAPGEFVVLKVPSDELVVRGYSYAELSRNMALAVVHQNWRYRFGNLVGNGVYRMRWRSDWRDHLRDEDEPEDLYLPDEYTPAEQFAPDVLAAKERMKILYGIAVADRPLANIHIRSMFDFVRKSGWGFVKTLEEVAGFKPHRFRHRPVVLDPGTQALAEWRITRLELVSLLKHDTPRVYLTDALPNMETLSSENVPTRELVRFERRALELLESGNDLVIDERPHDIRMLGSLRAVDNCRQCHEVPADSLLGAFSYELKMPAVRVTIR